ncbi:MAG: TIGR00159 family protein [Verrucomicrobia bacterium Tous-C9LFEB]|nr:MAG: TIGR00159 family protein [Verrucomicrobia bacterium Tous-C9LFEB]
MTVLLIIRDHWRWVVEIGILTCSLYYCWKLFRGTGGARVLAGLAILLASITLISVLLQLNVITAILQSFSTFFLLGLIVIFQPELRRILAEVGSRHLVSTTHQQTEVIESVVGAIEYLQSQRFGALIAFEREVSYEAGHITGTRVDSEVSTDLLSTIFYPKTPLHDGGVIIRRNRLVTAAAIFPLTQAEGLQRTLGLRHRAALGLSEESDAVVVVLSEETGTISVAHGGELIRPLNVDQLRARLTELLQQDQPSKRDS